MLLSSHTPDLVEVGLDEVGRGCLAGPVVAAAVILPKDYTNELLTDSKQVSEKKRLILEEDIKKYALDYAISEVSPQKIDEINILNASFLAMHQALDQLKIEPEFLLVDGNRFHKYKNLSHLCVVKGDGKYLSIAAASILAKNYRDQLMTELGKEFPMYDWHKNAAYPTKKHREAIKEFGITHWHRKSYNLLPSQLELFK
jgi:ribonuclease HII